MRVSSRQNYPLHRYFSVYTLQFGKLIPFLLLPEEFTILQSVLCEVLKEREIDGESRVIIAGFLLWLVFFSSSPHFCIYVTDLSSFFSSARKVLKAYSLLFLIPVLPFGLLKSVHQCLWQEWQPQPRKHQKCALSVSQVIFSGTGINMKKYQLEHAGHFKW